MRETVIILFAMSCILTLAIISLIKGIDGAVLASAFTVIAGLGGYTAGKRKQRCINSKTVLPPPVNKAE